MKSVMPAMHARYTAGQGQRERDEERERETGGQRVSERVRG